MTLRHTLLALALLGLISMRSPLLLGAETVSIGAFLDRVLQTSEDLRAIDLTMQSTQIEIEAREVELSPTIAVDINRFWDHRPGNSTNRQTFGNNSNLTLAKPFATGTRLSLLSELNTERYQDNPVGDQDQLTWEFGVSQSLWQNSFGRQVAYRRRRDQNELRSRFLNLTLQQQQILMDFEFLYWDLAYSLEEVRIRQQNLARSRNILSWVTDRYQRFAAESIDLLQAKALVSSRELQLQIASDTLKSLQSEMGQRLSDGMTLLPNTTDLIIERPLNLLSPTASFAPREPILIEALLAQADTNLAEAEARLQKDRSKPVFEVGYSYGQRGYDTHFSVARDEAFTEANNYHRVGLLFTTPLNFPLVAKGNKALALRTEAQSMRSSRLQRQSHLEWQDLVRIVEDLKTRITTATTLAKFQKDKAYAEKARYLKGRATAFEAITFEQEAAESDLVVLQLESQLRRAETRARAYIYSTGEKTQ